jgi:hypothetical protein
MHDTDTLSVREISKHTRAFWNFVAFLDQGATARGWSYALHNSFHNRPIRVFQSSYFGAHTRPGRTARRGAGLRADLGTLTSWSIVRYCSSHRNEDWEDLAHGAIASDKRDSRHAIRWRPWVQNSLAVIGVHRRRKRLSESEETPHVLSSSRLRK